MNLVKESKTVFFQPKNINKKYCEIGMLTDKDPLYIWYLDEPCKILISEVIMIPKDDVYYNKKQHSHMIKTKNKQNE